MSLTFQELESLIPNGTELIHLNIGPETDHVAFVLRGIVSQTILGEGPTLEIALMMAKKRLEAEDFWRSALSE